MEEWSEKKKAALNRYVTMDLTEGFTTLLVYHLKAGNAPHFTQDTWVAIARWIEGGAKRPRKRPATGQTSKIADRNYEIKAKYRKLRASGLSREEAVGMLADESHQGKHLGEETILNIVKRKRG